VQCGNPIGSGDLVVLAEAKTYFGLKYQNVIVENPIKDCRLGTPRVYGFGRLSSHMAEMMNLWIG
jgi:hypothetical protein